MRPKLRYVLLAVFATGAMLYVVAPLAVVVLNSFSPVAYNVFPPEGLSLRWYANLFSQPDFGLAALRSVVLATVSTALAMVLGTMASYALVRYRPTGREAINSFLMSPIVLPKIVLGVALFMFFVRLGLLNTYASLVLTHTLVVMPYVVSMVTAALLSFDWSLQEAALDLGARPLRSFRRIVMPQISTSLVIAFLFAWITSFDQVESTIFLVAPRRQYAADRDVPLPAEMAGPDHRGTVQPADPAGGADRAELGGVMRRRSLSLEILNRGH